LLFGDQRVGDHAGVLFL